MSYFGPAFMRTMDFEGRVLTNDPHDPGGQTLWGISRKNFPSWMGWAIVDQNGANDPDLPTLIEQFYTMNFWNVAQCNIYKSQELSNQVFDAFVNLGVRALKMLQNLLGVDSDGTIGPMTLDALGKIDQDVLARTYITIRENYYKQLASDHPNLARYLNGWLNRCKLSA